MSVDIYWTIPAEIVNTTNYDKIRIYRSVTEQKDYSLIATINSKTSNGIWVTTYTDTDPSASTNLWYLIKFFDSVNNVETQYYLTFFPLTPREMRLTNWLRGWLPEILRKDTTDDIYRMALQLALYNFNIYPPETDYTIDNFPQGYENVLIMSAQITFCMYKYLGIGITDFSYSDMGLSLTIDRGEKIRNAMKDIMDVYNELLSVSKMNFMHQGVGLGTLQLPISIGANLNRGLLNILDIFQSMGR